jgi:hypothetical protein
VRMKWVVETGDCAICFANDSFGDRWAQLYIMHRIVIESGFDFAHKWFYIGPPGGAGGQWGAGIWTSIEGAWNLRVIDGADNVPVDTSPDAVLGPRDTELAVEYLFIEGSTPSTADGQVYVWVNGTLVGSSTSVTQGGSINGFSGMHYYGDANVVPYTAYHRVRELYISGKN